jgi:Ran GTPase-activating protein (RanGAP) involved in mRNA processing and transport
VLTSLGLESNPIGVKGAKALASMLEVNAVLTECNVRGGNKLDSESAHALAEVATKKGVMLSGIKHDQKQADFEEKGLSPVDAILIASDLRVSAVLTSLDLSANHLCGLYLRGRGTYDPTGIQALASALSEGSAVLNKIVLSNNEINDEGAIAFVGALKTNKTIKELELANCEIGVDGAKALASMLKVNKVLNKIMLSFNNIKDEGAIALGGALKTNKTLKKLELEYCGIGPEGGKALASALSESSAVLTTLDLRDNQLTNYGNDMSGVLAIADALKVNAVLTSLVLKSNMIGVDGAKALASMLKVNRVLTKLDLRKGNSLGDEGEKALRDAAEGREGFELV